MTKNFNLEKFGKRTTIQHTMYFSVENRFQLKFIAGLTIKNDSYVIETVNSVRKNNSVSFSHIIFISP